MFHRYLTFLKIASDEYSDIVVDAELHADRLSLARLRVKIFPPFSPF